MATRMPEGPPWDVHPSDAIAEALTLLKVQAEAQVRTADALERIADALEEAGA